MYEHHFGLRARPFRTTDDSAYYYSAPHQVPSNTILYSIEERQGMAMITGLPGMGKTTLLKRLCQVFDSRIRSVLLSDTGASGASLLRRFADALGVRSGDEELVLTLVACLKREAAFGRTVVLLLDESQGLTREQFDEVRLLSNLEKGEHRLLEIVLAGQPSLEHRLMQPELVPVSQRLTVRTTVEPLTPLQTKDYILHRLAVAGARGRSVFDGAALQAIHDHARGVPRLINVLCERALIVGYADGFSSIGLATIEAAAADLGSTWGLEASGAVVNECEAPDAGLEAVNERLDRLEGKIDRLLVSLGRAGWIDPVFPEDEAPRSSPPSRGMVRLARARRENEDERREGTKGRSS